MRLLGIDWRNMKNAIVDGLNVYGWVAFMTSDFVELHTDDDLTARPLWHPKM
jgi:hypothetical protein